MKFRRTKRDYTQWHRYFAWLPVKVSEQGRTAEYVWLQHYEARMIKCTEYYADFENRRIGSGCVAVTTTHFD